MIGAINPQPGQRVLELAAGVGETGMLAAQLVAPGGEVVISDQAETMLEGARARAAALGLTNVDSRSSTPNGSTCRWQRRRRAVPLGYMLTADPAAALADTRRVVRPSGRLALAVWDDIRANPWALLPGLELRERGLAGTPIPPPGPVSPRRPRARGRAARRRGLHRDRAGRHRCSAPSQRLRRVLDVSLDISRGLHDAVMARPQGEIEEIKASLGERFAPFRKGDGSLEIPARTLVASATA